MGEYTTKRYGVEADLATLICVYALLLIGRVSGIIEINLGYYQEIAAAIVSFIFIVYVSDWLSNRRIELRKPNDEAAKEELFHSQVGISIILVGCAVVLIVLTVGLLFLL